MGVLELTGFVLRYTYYKHREDREARRREERYKRKSYIEKYKGQSGEQGQGPKLQLDEEYEEV